jgi:hypothetical protein
LHDLRDVGWKEEKAASWVAWRGLRSVRVGSLSPHLLDHAKSDKGILYSKSLNKILKLVSKNHVATTLFLINFTKIFLLKPSQAKDLSNFEISFNSKDTIKMIPVRYQISRDRCWLPIGRTHKGCKCDLKGQKICERNVLLYNTIYNRCDHNCESSVDCKGLQFAYCCQKSSNTLRGLSKY